MNETVDGEYQAMKARDGAYVREKFFGKYPETQITLITFHPAPRKLPSNS